MAAVLFIFCDLTATARGMKMAVLMILASLYVGKAKALRSRVRSYFQHSQEATTKTRCMVSKIADIETIVTSTEKDALILENNLIKKYRPRYNVIFRDDKEYPYLRLAAGELYPNLTIVRRTRKDGSA
jgi:excinuclease ABC subunit C